jgi:hypothetical protein
MLQKWPFTREKNSMHRIADWIVTSFFSHTLAFGSTNSSSQANSLGPGEDKDACFNALD